MLLVVTDQETPGIWLTSLLSPQVAMVHLKSIVLPRFPQPDRKLLVHRGIFAAAIVVLGSLAAAIFAQVQTVQLRAQATQAKEQLQTDPVQGFVLAMQTASQAHRRWWGNPLPEVDAVLLEAVQTARERNRFDRQSPVYAVAFSPDRGTIATAGAGSQVQLWSGTQPPKLLQGNSRSIHALTFSPDGQMLVGIPAVGSGEAAQLWEVASRVFYPGVTSPQNQVVTTAFSPDGQTVAGGSVDGGVYLWNRQGEAISRLLPLHLASVTAVAFNQFAIASSSEDGMIHLWNQKGEFQGQLWAGTGVSSIDLNAGGDRIITQSSAGTQAFLWDGVARRWNAVTLSADRLAADLSPHNQTIAQGSPNGAIHLRAFNAEPNAAGVTLQGHRAAINTVRFSPDGQALLSGSEDGTARLWDVTDGTLIQQGQLQNGSNQPGGIIALSPTGEKVAMGLEDGSISIRDWEGKLANLLTAYAPGQIQRMQFDPQGEKLVVHIKRIENEQPLEQIEVWDLEQNSVTFSFPLTEPIAHFVPSQNQRLILITASGKIEIRNDRGTVIATTALPSSAAHLLAVSPNGQQFITVGKVGEENQTCLWQVRSTQLVQQACHALTSQSAAFHPHSATVAIGSTDGTVQIWDLRTDHLSQPEQRHTQSVTSIAFSAAGNAIVSGSSDGTVQLWSAAGRPLGQPFTTEEAIRSVGFSADGERIISLGQQGELQVRQASWEGWMQVACQRLQYHPVLQSPTTAIERSVQQICQQQTATLASATPTPSSTPEQPAMPQEVRLVVKLGERQVHVYRGDAIQASYPIAIGKAGWETPTGTFKVMQMMQNPAWTHPMTREVFAPGGDNPLGDRWIAFWTNGNLSIGFHGTPDRGSVGQPASHGCLRMLNEDIHALYEWVKLGTTVTVEP